MAKVAREIAPAINISSKHDTQKLRKLHHHHHHHPDPGQSCGGTTKGYRTNTHHLLRSWDELCDSFTDVNFPPLILPTNLFISSCTSQDDMYKALSSLHMPLSSSSSSHAGRTKCPDSLLQSIPTINRSMQFFQITSRVRRLLVSLGWSVNTNTWMCWIP